MHAKWLGMSLLATMIAGSFESAASATRSDTPRTVVSQIRKTTKALSFLDGVWSGPAWVLAPDGKRYELQQTETICPLLFGEVRVMEGRGEADGQIRFQALTIFEGKADGEIAMRSYTPGRVGDYPLVIRSDGFSWGYKVGEKDHRYNVTISDGIWTELGEVSAGPGKPFVPTFGMTLKKQMAAPCLRATPDR